MGRGIIAMNILFLLLLPSIAVALPVSKEIPEWQTIPEGHTLEIPFQISNEKYDDEPWWLTTTLDNNRNKIHDSLETVSEPVSVGISYDHTPVSKDIQLIEEMGYSVNLEVPEVDALLIGTVNSSDILKLSNLDGVVMVERYGEVVFYGDIQTPAVKARNSTLYPVGAWDLGVSGKGVNIALTDTGVDNEHPGLSGKFVAGYDAVCYMHTDLHSCALAGGRETDGSFDPDDGNQHGTACMGMAAATGIEADGSQSDFYGSAPDASLVDVRIGTDVGAGPFENYVISQDFYESAMNGIQWIIDNRDTAWPGVDESLHGIDIISLSWGITSHEDGGSDGEDMFSRLLDEAMEVGVTVSVAAGNDGPDNDGLSGMGSSSLSITVGATDDQNTIDREDDTIASYSSRGPRRDNGNNNPLDEFKPEVTAPGTNIIQAEGCVTSGGCSNIIDDAADNTYTGRGSGTSYATPAVTGVIALMMEANPDLDPLQIKEILKQTAERRGEPFDTSIDPFWNKDFGWGMVDAHAAVKLSFDLLNSGMEMENYSPYLQLHITSFSEDLENSSTMISGIAWAQQGEVSAIEYNIDGGAWYQATYEEVNETNQNAPFNWSIELDPGALSDKNHTIQIRSVGAGDTTNQYSLLSILTIRGTGVSDDSSGGINMFVIISLFIIIGFLLVMFMSQIRQPELLPSYQESMHQGNNSSGKVLDAELLDVVEDFEKNHPS
ncbi:MAG: S8 family serine peptidase [Candidatus Thermoplasmatota archaeon]|nr:S8 family serine peptidase [Candidatus Thermoplasmatota archaeon]